MRFYSWVVMYLEGIHAGIQTAHVQGAIHSKYRSLVQDEIQEVVHGRRGDIWTSKNYQKLKLFEEWESEFLVTQVYNGGYSDSLYRRFNDLSVYAEHFNLPYAKFHESKEALDGALTAVGIIVPEHLYSNKNRDADPESNEGAFYRLLHNCKHAR